MRRKIIIWLILLVVLLLIVIGITYIIKPEVFVDDARKPVEPQIEAVRYPVESGEIAHTFEADGSVVSDNPDLYIEQLTINYTYPQNFTLFKNKGDSVSSGDLLYQNGNTKKSVDYNGLVTDIYNGKLGNGYITTISLLNYDKLFINSEIPLSEYKKIAYNTPVTVKYDSEDYPSSIRTIGYEIKDDKVPLTVNMPTSMLPGTKLKLVFTTDIQESGLYINEDAVSTDGTDYYALLESGDGNHQVTIKTGQHFTREENGVTWKFVEIISGLKEGDVVISEKIVSTDASALKE